MADAPSVTISTRSIDRGHRQLVGIGKLVGDALANETVSVEQDQRRARAEATEVHSLCIADVVGAAPPPAGRGRSPEAGRG